MQPNKTKLALVIGALYLGVSGASNAADSQSYPITVTTIDDVTITPIANLDFGANIFTDAGGVCVLDATVPPSAVILSDATATSTGTNWNVLDGTGGGCINGATTATSGVYEITGATAGDVTITVSGISTADYTFVPDKSATFDYAATASNDGSITAISGPTSVHIANTGEGGSNGATAGKLRFTVGGTLTVVQQLTQGTPYTGDQFQVEVVYD